jgi:indole-3-glycerol phosphate synthase
VSFLERIRPAKLAEVDALRSDRPVPRTTPVRSLSAALRRPGRQVLAELKRASPSRGPIRPGADPVDIARAYQDAGAAGLSVLTDGPHFGGSLRDLERIRDAVQIPVLRKDFILHELQLDQARAVGADAALLIVAFLTPERLAELLAHAHGLGLEVLVETHSAQELQVAQDAGARIVGVNSRDLRSLHIDLAVAEALLPGIPSSVVRVAESGIHGPADAARMEAAGADALLVGTHLMTQPDPGQALRDLLCS